MSIQLKRAYDKPSVSDGVRVLVDRLWPRGVSKDKAAIDEWLRDLAPSDSLRHWYHTNSLAWTVFRKRYLHELNEPSASAALERLYDLARKKKMLTLVYSARNTERNNAVVLKELLEGMRKPPSSSGPAKVAAVPMRATRRK
ncbi:MAG: DUF488 family protein [Candidatus Koribacter versatilis]|uniref:DUF488 family protein n=1 Tax=Candidatus Korobacter versatilis TaxID=658062 RepID=A0A932ENY4_9BACT|nr:DUF488 family protein [Candidatus Koribacter versatilis]